MAAIDQLRIMVAAEVVSIEVHFYEAGEINEGEGGPTCLTRPITRG